VEDLRADWKAIRAKGDRPKKRKHVDIPDALHEDWIAVKGGKHPPYAYIVKWEYPSAIVVWKMAIMGKARINGISCYRVRCAGLLYKSPGYKVYGMDRPGNGKYERTQLCFTREEVEQNIEGHRRWHLDSGGRQMRKLADLLEDTLHQMKGMGAYMEALAEDPVPLNVLGKIPSKRSRESP
jgi:hypothetical protein